MTATVKAFAQSTGPAKGLVEAELTAAASPVENFVRIELSEPVEHMDLSLQQALLLGETVLLRVKEALAEIP